VLNLVLRRQKIMGFTAIAAVLIATLLGGRARRASTSSRPTTISASTGS
jgi:hypothetical protein